MPPLFGLLGSLISFRILPVYLAVFIILMITMTELTFKITAKNGRHGEPFIRVLISLLGEGWYCTETFLQ